MKNWDRGLSLDKCLPAGGSVLEGVRNSVFIHELVERHKIEMPICNSVYQVLQEGISSAQALNQMLERDRPEEEMMFFPNVYNNNNSILINKNE